MKNKRRWRQTRGIVGRNPDEQTVEQAPLDGSGGDSSIPRANFWVRFKYLLASPINGASLAVFRIAVGIVMALEACALCRRSPGVMGKSPLETFYTGANIKFTFPYEGFQWLPMLAAHWIYVIVGIQVLAGITMALGFWYRASAATLFLSWGYLYAVESTRTYWMSHHYLELLVTFLMIWMPAARKYSVDAWLARGRKAPGTVPYWSILLLRGQLVISYFYAGVAKVNADWLLDAQPVRYFLAKARSITDYGPHLTTGQLEFAKRILHSTEFAYFISYAGAIFDLSVGFLLLIRRTRIFGVVLMLIFHATNHFIIFDDIGLFPLLGVTTALIFLDADWPERFWRWLRRPRLAKPDWPWFAGGGISFPLVGVSLGWKLSPGNPPIQGWQSFRLGYCVAPFVVVWLVWQTLMPLRQYLIPGDGRFTWEGLSFSWRLKAEVYRSGPCELSLEDQSIISRDADGRIRINWNEWHGDKVIYRTLTPGQLDWSQIPEIAVVLEPMIGERVVYNPFAGSKGGRVEAASRDRLNHIWQELYRRQPQKAVRTYAPSQVLTAYARALQSKGYAVRSYDEIMEVLKKLYGQAANAQIIPVFREMNPFGIESEISSTSPFLVIEDASLIRETPAQPGRIDANAWVNGSYTRGEKDLAYVHVGKEPLVIHTGDFGLETKDLLPQAAIFDSLDPVPRLPSISWNYLKELTYAQGMHISMQPFLLRQYARHVATLWQTDYGRRAAVHALTVVSLNGRPFQQLVDPDADLASVSASWFCHHSWIRQLQTPRIPPGGLEPVDR